MLQYDFEQSIGYWLTHTTQAFHRAFSDEIAPYGITYRQAQVLFWLGLAGELSQSELAERMFVEPPTLAGILDRMERSGWITRRPCDEDRRRKWIRMTDEAAPAWEQVVACARRIRARATRGMSDRQLATLKKLLDQVQQNVSADVDAARPGRNGAAQRRDGATAIAK